MVIMAPFCPPGEEVESPKFQLTAQRRSNTVPLMGQQVSALEDALNITKQARAASLSALPTHGFVGHQPYQAAFNGMAGHASAMRPAGPQYTHFTQVL